MVLHAFGARMVERHGFTHKTASHVVAVVQIDREHELPEDIWLIST
jgi:hypothetical protein